MKERNLLNPLVGARTSSRDFLFIKGAFYALQRVHNKFRE